MKEENGKNKTSKKLIISSMIIAISIIVLGVSITYAFFTMRFSGSAPTPENKTPNFDVTSTLTSATAIDATEMKLIDATEVNDKAKKVEFSVTNEDDSEIGAKYTLKLKNLRISKNLSSQYFKWKLVVNGDEENAKTGTFLDAENIGAEGNTNKEEVTLDEKIILSEDDAINLAIGASDSLVFYVWLENNPALDQLYLTSGTFSAKLSVEAFPVKQS